MFSEEYNFDDDYVRVSLAMGGNERWLKEEHKILLSSKDYEEGLFSPVQRRYVETMYDGERRELRVRWHGGRLSYAGRPITPGEWMSRDSFVQDLILNRQQQLASMQNLVNGESPPPPPPPPTPIVFIVARVIYDDVFDRRHETLYCARWVDPPSNELAI